MSEKVKCNTCEMADPEHLGFNTKRTDLLDAVTKIWENRFTAAILENGLSGRNWRWPYIQIFLYFCVLRLCHISHLYHKTHNSFTYRLDYQECWPVLTQDKTNLLWTYSFRSGIFRITASNFPIVNILVGIQVERRNVLHCLATRKTNSFATHSCTNYETQYFVKCPKHALSEQLISVKCLPKFK